MSTMSASSTSAIPIEQALRILTECISPIKGSETKSLNECLGRLATKNIYSEIDLPRTFNSAVDGYGICSKTLSEDSFSTFKIVGVARAGHPFNGIIKFDEAVEIYTGAVMPKGPDCVAMHEDCEIKGNCVFIKKSLQAGNNVRPPGENLAKGEVVIARGQRVTPALIGQIAAAGHNNLTVQKDLRVGIMSTGDEVSETGDSIEDGQIFDSNRPMLQALLADPMLDIYDCGIVRDSFQAVTSAFEKALANFDVVISSGGASDGIEDHTQAAMQAVGADCVFWRLAMKPGRPMAVGQLGQKLIFCLPGNPVAAFVCTKLLIMPLLTYLAGGIVMPPLKFLIPAGFTHKKAVGRAEYLRATVLNGKGFQEIKLHGRKGAGVISSLTGADGLVEIPLENAGVEPGMPLYFLPFGDRVL